MMYRIETLIEGETVSTFETQDKKAARQRYWKTADNESFYTRLYIGGIPQSTKQAQIILPRSKAQAIEKAGKEMYGYFLVQRQMKEAERL